MGREFSEGTEIAKNIFSTVSNIQQKFGFGVLHIASILTGSESAKVIKYEHNKLTEFGVLKPYSIYQVKAWVRELSDRGYLEIAGAEYPVVKLLDKSEPVLKGLERVNLSEPDPELARKFPPKGESAATTLAMYKDCKSVEEIATVRGLAITTIMSHLAQAFEAGEEIDINAFVDSKKQETIAREFQKLGTEHLSPVKNILGPSYSWEDLRWVRAKLTREQAIGKQAAA